MNVGTDRERGDGFTLVELLVTLLVVSVVMGLGMVAFSEYQSRSSARRAAELFSRDLALGRSTALRSRLTVSVRFVEDSLIYHIQPSGEPPLLTRNYGGGGDFTLASLDLRITGDSVVYSSGGIMDLAGVDGSVGEAVFTAGEQNYTVVFNSLGTSRIRAP